MKAGNSGKRRTLGGRSGERRGISTCSEELDIVELDPSGCSQSAQCRITMHRQFTQLQDTILIDKDQMVDSKKLLKTVITIIFIYLLQSYLQNNKI